MNARVTIIVSTAAALALTSACARDARPAERAEADRSGARWETAERDIDAAEREQTPRATEPPPMGDEAQRLDTEADRRGPYGQAEYQQRLQEACPMDVEGAEVEIAEVPNGAALRFTTEDDVDELRERVERFAALHNEQFAESQEPMGGRAEPGQDVGGGAGQQLDNQQRGQGGAAGRAPIASRAQVVEIEEGAQLIVTPRDPRELSALRMEMQQQAASMEQGVCPVFGGSGAQQTLGG